MEDNEIKPISGIERFRITKLFGRFDYDIYFPQDTRLLILTAPNGFGKTTVLQIIHNFCIGNFHFLLPLLFEEIEVCIAGPYRIRINKMKHTVSADDRDATAEHSLLIELLEPTGECGNTYEFRSNTSQSEEMPSWSAAARYLHLANFELYPQKGEDSADEDDSKIADGKVSSHGFPPNDLPNWLELAIWQNTSHLIGTHRLFSSHTNGSSRWAPQSIRNSRVVMVEKKAKDLADRIETAVSEYASVTQKLDQSFPTRVISNMSPAIVGESEIRQQLSDLADQRSELIEAGLISKGETNYFSENRRGKNQNLSDKTVRSMLSIYIADNHKKLPSL